MVALPSSLPLRPECLLTAAARRVFALLPSLPRPQVCTSPLSRAQGNARFQAADLFVSDRITLEMLLFLILSRSELPVRTRLSSRHAHPTLSSQKTLWPSRVKCKNAQEATNHPSRGPELSYTLTHRTTTPSPFFSSSLPLSLNRNSNIASTNQGRSKQLLQGACKIALLQSVSLCDVVGLLQDRRIASPPSLCDPNVY